MLIVLFLLALLILSLVITYFRYQSVKSFDKRKSVIINKSISSTIDSDILRMKIEGYNTAFESRFLLQKRSSWRLTQGRFITKEQFDLLKSREYSLKL